MTSERWHGTFSPQPKPEPRARTKARAVRAKDRHVHEVREMVFHDGGHACVVCGWRAESLHEIVPASVVGSRILATSREMSVPVCGSGTTKCHGLLQQHLIRAVDIKGRWRFLVDVSETTHPEIKALWRRVAMAQQQQGEAR